MVTETSRFQRAGRLGDSRREDLPQDGLGFQLGQRHPDTAPQAAAERRQRVGHRVRAEVALGPERVRLGPQLGVEVSEREQCRDERVPRHRPAAEFGVVRCGAHGVVDRGAQSAGLLDGRLEHAVRALVEVGDQGIAGGGMVGEQMERPGDRGRRGLVTGQHEAGKLVQELRVVQPGPVLVACVEQHGEHVVAVDVVGRGPACGDLLAGQVPYGLAEPVEAAARGERSEIALQRLGQEQDGQVAHGDERTQRVPEGRDAGRVRQAEDHPQNDVERQPLRPGPQGHALAGQESGKLGVHKLPHPLRPMDDAGPVERGQQEFAVAQMHGRWRADQRTAADGGRQQGSGVTAGEPGVVGQHGPVGRGIGRAHQGTAVGEGAEREDRAEPPAQGARVALGFQEHPCRLHGPRRTGGRWEEPRLPRRLPGEGIVHGRWYSSERWTGTASPYDRLSRAEPAATAPPGRRRRLRSRPWRGEPGGLRPEWRRLLRGRVPRGPVRH